MWHSLRVFYSSPIHPILCLRGFVYRFQMINMGILNWVTSGTDKRTFVTSTFVKQHLVFTQTKHVWYSFSISKETIISINYSQKQSEKQSHDKNSCKMFFGRELCVGCPQMYNKRKLTYIYINYMIHDTRHLPIHTTVDTH